MDATKCLLFLLFLGFISVPCVSCLEAETFCPINCNCSRTAGDVLCFGGRFQRLPDVPPDFTHLWMKNPLIENFSLGDLALHLDTVTIQGVKAANFSTAGPAQASNVTQLEVDGCCADQFPNVSNFVNIKMFSYKVRCREDGSPYVIRTETIGALGSSYMSGGHALRISDTCLSQIEQSALRRLFRFKNVYLSGNRLTELSVGSDDAKGFVQLLDVSANLALTQLDLGQNQIRTLTLSATKINVSAITTAKKKIVTLTFSQGNETLRASEVCEAFPDLVDLTTHDRRSLDLSGIGRCKFLQVLQVHNSRQETMPDFSKISLYKLDAASNFYSKLDPSLLPQGISLLYVRDNRIEDIVLESCGGLTKLRTIDVSRNKLQTLPSHFLYCLMRCKTLIVSENPMQDIFKAYNDSVIPKMNLKKLRMEALVKIQGTGKLPRLFIKHFASIEELYAGRNGLESLSETTELLRHAGLHPEMETLSLTGNKFEAVGSLPFLGFRRLKKLDLAANEISSIDTSAFLGLPSLKSLRLQGNRLSVLEPWFVALPTTLKLDVSRNSFDCSCEAVQAMKMKIPALSRNSSLFSNVRGLRCSSPGDMKYFPITVAAEKTPALCRKTVEDEVPSQLLPTSQPIPHSTLLTSVLAATAAVLLLALVLTVVCVVSKKRKMSNSYPVSKSLISSV